MADSSHIRRARLDDVGAIYDVIRENPEEVLPRSIHDITSHFDRFYIYDDGEVRGVISWQVLPVLDLMNPDRCLEVISLSVRKEDQGKGIGRLLVEHLLGILRDLQPDRIIVLTFYPEFFKRFGFAETSKEKLYYKIYVGCIHCTRYTSPLTCPEKAMELVVEKKSDELRAEKSRR